MVKFSPWYIFNLFIGLILIAFAILVPYALIGEEVLIWRTNENCILIDISGTQTINNGTNHEFIYNLNSSLINNNTQYTNNTVWTIIEIYSLRYCNITLINIYNEIPEYPEIGSNVTCYFTNENDDCEITLDTYDKDYGHLTFMIFISIIVEIVLLVIGFVGFELNKRERKNSTVRNNNPTEVNNSIEMNKEEFQSSEYS